MQEIIVQPKPPTHTVEQDFLECIRSCESIQSIIVMSTGNVVSREMSNERKPMVSGLQEGYRVSDLLSNIEYAVTPWRGLRLLSFTQGQHEIRATVQPDADIVEVANFIGSHIETIVSSN